MKKVKGFIAALAISAVMAVVAIAGGNALLPHTAEAASSNAYEVWSGNWADSRGAQGGRLEFILTGDGRINGKITNGTVSGSWNGYMREDGVMVASYQYPTFGAYAEGRILQQQGNRVFGHIVFGQNNTVFGEGQFELIRSNVSPQPVISATPSFSSCPPSFDQTTCQLLRSANSEISASRNLINELARQGITATSGGLIGRCQNGDLQACAQYNRQADVAMENMRNRFGQDWVRSFGFGGN